MIGLCYAASSLSAFGRVCMYVFSSVVRSVCLSCHGVFRRLFSLNLMLSVFRPPCLHPSVENRLRQYDTPGVVHHVDLALTSVTALPRQPFFCRVACSVPLHLRCFLLFAGRRRPLS